MCTGVVVFDDGHIDDALRVGVHWCVNSYDGDMDRVARAMRSVNMRALFKGLSSTTPGPSYLLRLLRTFPASGVE